MAAVKTPQLWLFERGRHKNVTNKCPKSDLHINGNVRMSDSNGITLHRPCDPGLEHDWLLTHQVCFLNTIDWSVIALPYQMGLERSLRDLLVLDLIVACLYKANQINHV